MSGGYWLGDSDSRPLSLLLILIATLTTVPARSRGQIIETDGDSQDSTTRAITTWYNDTLPSSLLMASVGNKERNDTTAKIGVHLEDTTKAVLTSSGSPADVEVTSPNDLQQSSAARNEPRDVQTSTTLLLASGVSLHLGGNGTATNLITIPDATMALLLVSKVGLYDDRNGTAAAPTDSVFPDVTSSYWKKSSQLSSSISDKRNVSISTRRYSTPTTNLRSTSKPAVNGLSSSALYTSSRGKVTRVVPSVESWMSFRPEAKCNAIIMVHFDGDCPSIVGEKLMIDVFSIENNLFLETQLNISRDDVTVISVKCNINESAVIFTFKVMLSDSHWLFARGYLTTLVAKRLWKITINRSQYTFDFLANSISGNCSLFPGNAHTHSIPIDSDEALTSWPWVAVPRMKLLVTIAVSVGGGVLLCLLLSCILCAIARRNSKHKAAFNLSSIAEESWSDITLEKMHRSVPIYCEPGVIFVDLDSNDIVDRSVLQQASGAVFSRQQAQTAASASSSNSSTVGMEFITEDADTVSGRNRNGPQTRPLGVSSSEPLERASSFDNHSYIRDESLS